MWDFESHGIVERHARPKPAHEHNCLMELAFALAGMHVMVTDYIWCQHGQSMMMRMEHCSYQASLWACWQGIEVLVPLQACMWRWWTTTGTGMAGS